MVDDVLDVALASRVERSALPGAVGVPLLMPSDGVWTLPSADVMRCIAVLLRLCIGVEVCGFCALPCCERAGDLIVGLIGVDVGGFCVMRLDGNAGDLPAGFIGGLCFWANKVLLDGFWRLLEDSSSFSSIRRRFSPGFKVSGSFLPSCWSLLRLRWGPCICGASDGSGCFFRTRILIILTKFFRADFGIFNFTIKDFLSGLSNPAFGAGEALDSSFDLAARPFAGGRVAVIPFGLRFLSPWSGADTRCFCWDGNGFEDLEVGLGSLRFLDVGMLPGLLGTVLGSLELFFAT